MSKASGSGAQPEEDHHRAGETADIEGADGEGRELCRSGLTPISSAAMSMSRVIIHDRPICGRAGCSSPAASPRPRWRAR